jgi:hypothetical protein
VPVEYQTCFNTAEQAANFTSKMVKYWNDNIGKGGWGTIGPRMLTLNTDINGTIVSQGDRMFITPYPLKKRYSQTRDYRKGWKRQN